MQKFFVFSKTIVRIIVATLVVLFVLFFPIISKVAYPKNQTNELFFTQSSEIVLDMWHIEAFEGGNSARKTFLDKLFKLYNCQNLGVFISLNVMSLEQFKINISKSKPDIISFTKGCQGVEKYLLPLARTKLLSQDILSSVKWDNSIICYPYMLGRYALVSYNENYIEDIKGNIVENKNKQIFPLGYAADVNCLRALSCNNISFSKSAKSYSTQYDVYKAFLKRELRTMIASQRDVHRLKNREQNGSIESLFYNYLDGYTDLVQYIGVTDSCKNIDIAKDFCEFVLQSPSQSLISSCGMFSINQKIYDGGYMAQWEKQIKDTSLESLFGE